MLPLMPSAPTRAPGRYSGRRVVLTTKHKKADALALPFLAGLGAVVETVEADTDALGTFTGEIERAGTPVETAVKKARLGMNQVRSSLGLANEGSFGPHPYVPFIPGSHEVIVFIDDELGIEITESIVTASTNYGHIDVKTIEDTVDFLDRVKFPSHSLIVRPHREEGGLLQGINRLLSGRSSSSTIQKGIRDREALRAAIELCRQVSDDGLAHVETDMRAHMNPTRMRVLRSLGINLAKRLRNTCPECNSPGFGITGAEGALPCEDCGYPSESPASEIHSCGKCHHQRRQARSDGITTVEAIYCQRCNP